MSAKQKLEFERQKRVADLQKTKAHKAGKVTKSGQSKQQKEAKRVRPFPRNPSFRSCTMVCRSLTIPCHTQEEIEAARKAKEAQMVREREAVKRPETDHQQTYNTDRQT